MALTKIPASFLDKSSNVDFADNEQIRLGTGNDLQIFHNATDSIIFNQTGALMLRGNDVRIQSMDASTTLAKLTHTGSVDLYHNNQKKLETTSTGATVTGNLAVTGDLNITGNVNSASVTDLDVTDKTITLGAGQTEALSGGSGIIIDGSSASILWDETNSEWDFNKDINVTGTATMNGLAVGTTSDAYSQVLINSSTTGESELRMGDTDTDAGSIAYTNSNDTMTFRAAAGARMSLNSTGIGVTGNGRFDSVSGNALRLDRVTSGNNIDIDFYNPIGTAGVISRIRTDGDGLSNLFGALSFHTGTTPDSPSEAMRIDSSGKVGIGASSPTRTFEVNSGTTNVAARFESTDSRAVVEFKDPSGTAELGGIGSDIYFAPAGVEKVRIDSSGNVGIGESNPDNILHVKTTASGGPQIHLDTGTGSAFMNFDGANLQLSTQRDMRDGTWHDTSKSWGGININGTTSGSNITFATAGNNNTSPTTRMTIDKDGNVGIGVSPTEKLTVTGAITTTGALSDDRTSTGSMDFVSGYTRFVSYGASGERGAFTFNTAEGGSSSSQKVVIDGLGRIGVGTINPQTYIHIRTTSPGISFTDTNSFSDSNDRFQIRANSDNGQFQWYDDSAGTTYTHMTITQDGNIGIGQTTPYVSGTNFTSLSLGGSSGRSGLTEYKYSNNASKGFLYAQSNALTLEAAGTNFIRFATNGAFRGAIDSGGTLYFGDGDDSYAHNNYAHAAVFTKNSTPDGTVVIEDMDVSTGIGNTILKLYFRDADPITHATFIDMQGGGNGRIGSVQQTDAGTGVVYNTSSDYRLKENVNYDWDATTLLKQLKPAKFNFISKPSNEVQGFLAHEVSDLVPSSVSGEKDHIEPIGTITDSDGDVVSEEVYEHFCKEGQTWSQTGSRPVYQQIDHSKLVPLLTKAIQEQQTIIEDLKTRIETLEG